MEGLNLEKRKLRTFGMTMGIAFLGLTLFIWVRKKEILAITSFISAALFVLAVIAPRLLNPVYIFWMQLTSVLGWLNTRIILLGIFYLIFTPISLVIKLFRVDLLDRRIEKNKASYWKKKEMEVFNPVSYERQF